MEYYFVLPKFSDPCKSQGCGANSVCNVVNHRTYTQTKIPQFMHILNNVFNPRTTMLLSWEYHSKPDPTRWMRSRTQSLYRKQGLCRRIFLRERILPSNLFNERQLLLK